MSERFSKPNIVKALTNVAEQNLCIFVASAPDGKTPLAVQHYVSLLRQSDFKCMLVLVMERTPNKSFRAQAEQVDGLMLRTAHSFEFGGWADALRNIKNVWRAKSVLLANDGLVGPLFNPAAFFKRLRESKADLVGLTETLSVKTSMPSAFMLMNSNMLKSKALQHYWLNMPSFPPRHDLRQSLELNFANFCESNGFTCEALYPAKNYENWGADPGIYLWKSLIDDGFPFANSELIRNYLGKIGRQELLALTSYEEAKAIIQSF